MMRRVALALLAAFLALPALAGESLTAGQIVEKNVAARGSLEAWRKIDTMAWAGHIEPGGARGEPLSFLLEMKRPNKTRFEIHAHDQKSIRIFDGSHGWKLRPSSSGYPNLEPYTAQELEFARDSQVIDGPLIDYQTKGVSVTLDGVDEIAGNRAYRLNVRLPSGTSHHVWVDAKSFLDIKSDREARNALGMRGTVSVYYRNYQSIDGLKLPFLIETGGDNGTPPDRMVIDRIVLNPPLEDWMFAKPKGPDPRDAVWAGAAQWSRQAIGTGAGKSWRQGSVPASLPTSDNAH